MQFGDDGKLCKSMINSVFVYGTLKRGHCREKCWPVSPDSRLRGMDVRSVVLARRLSRDARRRVIAIAGECWEFDPDVMDRVLRRLDEVEGTNQSGQPDLYHRVTVELFDRDGNAMQSAYGYRYAPIRWPTDSRSWCRSRGDYVAWPEIEGS